MVQVILRERNCWACECCETENEALSMLPGWGFVDLTTTCITCEQPAPEEILQIISEAKQERQQTAAQRASTVVQQVDEAFRGVTLGTGISLHEAVGGDWCISLEQCEPMSRHDERVNWKRIPQAAERQAATGTCRCGCEPGSTRFQRTQGTLYPFSFFDPQGFRFHLPAYLVDAVEKAAGADVERAEEILQCVLCNYGPPLNQEELLNMQQCEVVAACFAFFVEMGACAESYQFSMDDLLQHHQYWATGLGGRVA
eukprot:gnl/MRDRNA2_/MRDRNA2_215968_c0_seq1.p1 gnl/MRDRNA2_/MRDRNA2_215968_c0~~gnl/MRDRNA2_/MRDRNA2_215968_c0_seq1.p1  ORF type:complete len:275 (-),score=49.58 gnl/MRDRNA2_/MRDRNA2_215968_c0_seq1:148-915(-)